MLDQGMLYQLDIASNLIPPRFRWGGLRPPAASRCSARKLAARFFPRRPPAYGDRRPNRLLR